MNIVLLETAEIDRPLPLNDPRTRHIRKVLCREIGDSFDVGEINGPRGKATVTAIDESGLHFDFRWNQGHTHASLIRLAIGFPRPQTARDVLRDATTLGVAELSFVATTRSDPNYAGSSLWSDGEWRRQTITGAAQAFDTFLPAVHWHERLAEVLDRWSQEGVNAVALDLYDYSSTLAAHLKRNSDTPPNGILIGPERGWDDADRALLQSHHIPRLSLGDRVLRTETAVTVTLGLLHAAAVRA